MTATVAYPKGTKFKCPTCSKRHTAALGLLDPPVCSNAGKHTAREMKPVA